MSNKRLPHMSVTHRALFALGILVFLGVFVGAQMFSKGCSGVECDVAKWTSVVAAFVLGALLAKFTSKASNAAPACVGAPASGIKSVNEGVAAPTKSGSKKFLAATTSFLSL